MEDKRVWWLIETSSGSGNKRQAVNDRAFMGQVLSLHSIHSRISMRTGVTYESEASVKIN